MGGNLPRALATARTAVRTATMPGEFVLVACSGGADSLALAAAAAFLNRKGQLRVGAVIVDHRMQDGSDAVAARAAGQCRDLGLDPVLVLPVDVAGDSEQAARAARYAAYGQALETTGATRILLGHTLDDQAEQVLLGLGRGSGTLSLAGMPAVRGPYLRPLLGMGRSAMEEICAHESLAYWTDPTNSDPKYLRNQVRHRLMPVLREVLGAGVPESLARTATLARQDAEYLDFLAGKELEAVRNASGPGAIELDLPALRELPDALRSRVLRLAVRELGAPAPDFERVAALQGLVFNSKSAGPVQLAGHVQAVRVAANGARTGSRATLNFNRTVPVTGLR
ncbi:tRNA lysidine(34) synthetase TilS [Paeniglutamicibacter sp. NPDC091659]|uniref:tRNA lysidine(34) synthetase TilS n=1 Tax=Paeniglutamicibacter sp. NPDC091659 TaxID=3364389 RepID=UPI00381271AC